MEKKNTILLTVIAVATLLVAVVGATFAYFTATSTTGEDNDTASTGTATTVGGVNLAMTSATTDNDIAYPGGYVVAGVSVTATNTDQKNSYDTSFNVVGTITNNTRTALNWYLYEVTGSIADPVSNCVLEEDETSQAGETRYWYSGCTLDKGIATTTNAIANGTVAAATGSQEESNYVAGTASVTTTKKEQLTIANATGEDTPGTTTTYYYLVVEYPNNTGASQDADQGQTIVAQLTNVSEPVSTVTQAEEP